MKKKAATPEKPQGLSAYDRAVYDIGNHVQALNMLINSSDGEGRLEFNQEDVFAIKLLMGHLDGLWVKFSHEKIAKGEDAR